MTQYTDYNNFAWLYNREWGAFGENIFPALKIIAGDKLPDKASILDLCCGTGQLAKVLTEKGYRVTGIDGSTEMLRYAKENAPAADFICSDARAFKLPPEYDAAFSTFDSLNHIMTLEGLEQVFKNVFNCLVNGGIFIFDMTMQKHFETTLNNLCRIIEKPEYLFALRTSYDAATKTGDWHCTVFRPEGALWKRADIYLHQTWYPCEDIKTAMEKAGFTGIRAHSFNQQRELVEVTKDTGRVFFYAQKT